MVNTLHDAGGLTTRVHWWMQPNANGREKQVIRAESRRAAGRGYGCDPHGHVERPFTSLWWMVTGRTLGGVQVRGPESSPSREQALRIYTLGSAWFNFDEGKLGSIEPGKQIIKSVD